MSGRPHFFCENCGTEVSRKAAKCPGCGRYFSSVRCPKCGFTGAEQLFSDGCPVCGYSTTPASAGGPEDRSEEYERPNRKRHFATESTGSLPTWVYVVTILAAAVVVVAAVLVLR